MAVKTSTKIGFYHVAAGLFGFAVSVAVLGLMGVYSDTAGIAIATSAMAMAVVNAASGGYKAGRKAAQEELAGE